MCCIYNMQFTMNQRLVVYFRGEWSSSNRKTSVSKKTRCSDNFTLILNLLIYKWCEFKAQIYLN